MFMPHHYIKVQVNLIHRLLPPLFSFFVFYWLIPCMIHVWLINIYHMLIWLNNFICVDLSWMRLHGHIPKIYLAFSTVKCLKEGSTRASRTSTFFWIFLVFWFLLFSDLSNFYRKSAILTGIILDILHALHPI